MNVTALSFAECSRASVSVLGVSCEVCNHQIEGGIARHATTANRQGMGDLVSAGVACRSWARG